MAGGIHITLGHPLTLRDSIRMQMCSIFI